MNKDFGTAFHKNNGNAVKVTVNEFRENLYLHIREYAMDGDTGQWFPTKSGFALPADEVCSPLSSCLGKFAKKPAPASKDLGTVR